MNIIERTKLYLQATSDKYKRGQHEYYARIALQQALMAAEEKDYAVGAVAVQATEEYVFEFRARATMITGVGVIDHAETKALIRLKEGREEPDAKYHRNENEWTLSLPEGISVFGTLEPCPMCTCTLTNAGAILSVSTVLDGELITTADGYKISNGAANSIGDKFRIQPLIWQQIQTAKKLRFELLNSNDEQLKELSAGIFLETRREFDKLLANKRKI